jgi:membrane protease YdiL (CAAX protease family)
MSFWQKAWIKLRTLLIAALALAVFICLEYVVFSVFAYFGIDRKIYRGAYNFATCILVFIAMFVYNLICTKKKKPVFRMNKLRPDQVAALMVVGLGMLGFVTTYLAIAEKIAEYKKPVSDAIQDYRESVDRFADVPQVVIPLWDSILYVVTLSFIVPITEEMTFRGVFFGELRKGFSPWIAVILSAIGFGLMHGLTVHIGYAIGCGLIIASCYYLTDSLIAPILLHMVFNVFGSGLPTTLSFEFLNLPYESTNAFMRGVSTTSIMFMPVSVLAMAYLVSVKRKREAEAKAKSEIISVTVPAQAESVEEAVETADIVKEDGSEADA